MHVWWATLHHVNGHTAFDQSDTTSSSAVQLNDGSKEVENGESLTYFAAWSPANEIVPTPLCVPCVGMCRDLFGTTTRSIATAYSAGIVSKRLNLSLKNFFNCPFKQNNMWKYKSVRIAIVNLHLYYMRYIGVWNWLPSWPDILLIFYCKQLVTVHVSG